MVNSPSTIDNDRFIFARSWKLSHEDSDHASRNSPLAVRLSAPLQESLLELMFAESVETQFYFDSNALSFALNNYDYINFMSTIESVLTTAC